MSEASAQPAAPALPTHIPSLDGLRAVSISLVVFAHAVSTHGAPAFLDRAAFNSLGNVGVRFFFIISGFLITTLLLRDVDRYGQVRMSTFYIRRVLRIMPASLFYILVIWAFYLAGMIDLTYHHISHTNGDSPFPELIHALTYTSNYQLDYNWYYNHLWSLSVEEQFYLLWPCTLFLLGLRRGFWCVVGTIAVVPFVRLAMHVFGNDVEIALSREFQAVCDSLATGCLTALLYNRVIGNRVVAALTRWPALPLGLLAVAIGYGAAFVYRPAAYIAGQTIANFGIVLILLHVITYPKSIAGRVLNSAPFVAVGILSYSLYLWQEPFLYFRGTSWVTGFPQNIVLAFAAATFSYFCIEKPFLALKDRISAAQATKRAAAAPIDSISRT